jgi:hypothetical protein
VIHETCPVCFVSHTDDGNASEKRLAELAGDPWPPGSCLDHDQGFQGCCLQDVTSVQPKTTPPGGERTPPEQATHRRRSSSSLRSEDALGGVKRDRIVKDNIRLLQDGMRDAVRETCGGWHHVRLQHRPWHYAS